MAEKSSTQVFVQAKNEIWDMLRTPELVGQLAVAAPHTVIVQAPAQELASNVAMSMVFFGIPPVAAHVPVEPPEADDHEVVFALS
jgi:hypothetical protein